MLQADCLPLTPMGRVGPLPKLIVRSDFDASAQDAAVGQDDEAELVPARRGGGGARRPAAVVGTRPAGSEPA
jgi:hypothetical protein